MENFVHPPKKKDKIRSTNYGLESTFGIEKLRENIERQMVEWRPFPKPPPPIHHRNHHHHSHRFDRQITLNINLFS
jgi:hypothetical protein